ncbi:MAG: methylamine utilization protein [Bryobacteraceae bacterium]|jgi:plastocyanin
MTFPWAISSSLAAIFLASLPLLAGPVTGKVELRDSREASVRKRLDYSGVVVSLTPAVPVKPVGKVHATMLQKNKMFSPHVLAVMLGTYVDFPNEDPIFHNAFSNYDGQPFDVALYPPGTSRSVLLSREGIVRVFCNIHSSMSAIIVVLPTPYFATTRKDGTFQIPNVPPGDYQLNVFHERATEATLHLLGRRITVEEAPLTLPLIVISEAGFLQMPHTNKYGQGYPPETDERGYKVTTK